MSKKKKSKIQIWAEYIPFLMLFKLIHALPLKVGYAFSSVIAFVVYHLDAKHRNRTIQHYLHAGIVSTRKEAVAHAKNCFRQFSMLLIEIVKSDQCYDPAKITMSGPQETLDEFDPAKRKYPNQIIVVAHYGNWEIAGRSYSEKFGVPMSSIMRPFDNPLIGKLILSHRASPTHDLIDKEGGMRKVLAALKQKKLFSILIDQHASRTEGVENIFFGHPCRTHMTPALLHLKTGIPIVPEVTKRMPGKDFRFELVVGPIIRYTPTDDKEQDIKNITQMCTTALEDIIRRDPDQWMWAARRWLDADNRSR